MQKTFNFKHVVVFLISNIFWHFIYDVVDYETILNCMVDSVDYHFDSEGYKIKDERKRIWDEEKNIDIFDKWLSTRTCNFISWLNLGGFFCYWGIWVKGRFYIFVEYNLIWLTMKKFDIFLKNISSHILFCYIKSSTLFTVYQWSGKNFMSKHDS